MTARPILLKGEFHDSLLPAFLCCSVPFLSQRSVKILTKGKRGRGKRLMLGLNKQLTPALASPVAQQQRIHRPVQESRVRSLGQEDHPEKGMTTHSSIRAWEIPWTEEPGGATAQGVTKESDTTQWLNNNNVLDLQALASSHMFSECKSSCLIFSPFGTACSSAS